MDFQQTWYLHCYCGDLVRNCLWANFVDYWQNCPPATHPYFRFRTLTGFSHNLICALILWRSFLLHLLVAGCDIGVRFSVRPSVSPSVRLSTFMLTFDIYVKVSILINYKLTLTLTVKPCMKHFPDLLTLQHRRPLFRMSAHSSVRLSTFMSKFDIYVKVSILINYKTKQPSNLAWNISLTSRLCDIGANFSHSSVRLLTVLLCRSSTFMSKLVF